MIVVVPLAYTFGRLEFKYKNTLTFAVLLSFALPPIFVLIPFYIIFTKIKLVGTLRGLILVDLTITIPFVTWMLLGYFRNLPPVERLARVDRYSRLGAFVRVIIPMGRVGIAVGAVISFLFYFFFALRNSMYSDKLFLVPALIARLITFVSTPARSRTTRTSSMS